MTRVEYSSDVYCSVDEVRKYFRKEDAFSSNTNPSDNEVLQMIREASTEIDNYTRTAFRPNQIIEETHNFDGEYRWSSGRPVMLNKMPIRTPFDSVEGDKIELWDGDTWVDWVSDSSYTEGRDADYWLESQDGPLWIYRRFIWQSWPKLRITYRYGRDTTTTEKSLDDGTTYEVIDSPHDIKRACALIVAIDLTTTDHYSQLVPGGEGGIDPNQSVEKWEQTVFGSEQRDGILDRYKIDPVWVEPL